MILYAILIGFTLAQIGLMLDMMFDYNNYFWRFRFGKFWKKASYAEKKFLAEEKLKADTYGQTVETMDAAYWQLVKSHWMLKRWICTKCLIIYLSIWVIVPLSIFVVIFSGEILFPFLTMATLWFFINMNNG